MNEPEIRARRWIASTTGYDEAEIVHRMNRSPDFLTPDGQGYEVKSCKYRRISTWPSQWKQLKKLPKCKILVFGKEDKPIAILDVSKIPFGVPSYSGVSITWLPRCPGATVDTLTQEEYLSLIKKDGNFSLSGKRNLLIEKHRREELSCYPDFVEAKKKATSNMVA